MKVLSAAELESLVEGAEVLSADRRGRKVMRLPDGRMVKLFRRKRLLSSAVLRPYARRFEAAARRLAGLGVPTVTVEDVFRVSQASRHGVVYRPLPGRTLREVNAAGGDTGRRQEELASFLAGLHRLGVFFRAIHLGNVVVLEGPRQGFGLIDIDEVRFVRPPLGLARRARNFRHLMKYDEDRRALARFGLERFVRCYLAHAALAPAAEDRLRRLLARECPLLAEALSARGAEPPA